MYNVRGFTKKDHRFQIEKLEAATKFHDIVGMLGFHLNQMKWKQWSNTTMFLFKYICHTEVTTNSLALKLISSSNQELEIAIVHNPNLFIYLFTKVVALT